MKVAVVGCGTVGPAAALLLARDGHDLEIFERAAVVTTLMGPRTSPFTMWQSPQDPRPSRPADAATVGG